MYFVKTLKIGDNIQQVGSYLVEWKESCRNSFRVHSVTSIISKGNDHGHTDNWKTSTCILSRSSVNESFTECPFQLSVTESSRE